MKTQLVPTLKSFIALSVTISVSVFSFQSYAQQGMGVGNNNPLEMLDVTGAIKVGTDLNNGTGAPSGGAGTIRYRSGQFEGWNGSAWVPFNGSTVAGWTVLGNSGTNATTNFFGTTDNVDLRVRTNNIDRLTVMASGTSINPRVGIGTTTVSVIPVGQSGLEIAGNVPQFVLNDLTGGAQDDFRIINGGGWAYFDNATTNTTIMSLGLGSNSNNVGIGTTAPDDRLHVVGNIRMVDGNQATGRIPVSDVNGKMTWTDPAMVVGNQAWKLTGNSGTSAATNFIGTTDNVDLRFRTNNAVRMAITAAGNVGIGTTNPSQVLEVNGRMAISHGFNATNVYVGRGAGVVSTTAFLNTAVGVEALAAITTSGDNTSIGYRNMTSLSTGGANSSLGSYALSSATTAGSNVAMGYGALNNLIDGSNNVAIGRAAGSGNTNGSGNVFLGYQAGNGSTGSNLLYIDNSSTANPLIYGDFSSNIININGNLGVNTAAPGQRLDVNGNARIQEGIVHVWANSATEGGQINLADGGIDADGQTNAWSIDVLTNDMRIMDDGTTRALFQDDGNLGIGTTSPLAKLHVAGNIRSVTSSSDIRGLEIMPTSPGAEGSTRIYFREETDDMHGMSMGFNGGNAGNEVLNWPANSFNISGHQNNATGNVWLTILRNDGNVGISTTAPTEKLDVNGKVRMRTGATNGYIPVSDANGVMTWTAPSSIGADVTTASNGLTEVGDDIQLGGALTASTTVTQDNAEVLTFANNGTANTVVNLQSTGDFDVQDNGTSAFFVRDDGNVGVGITAPTAKLQVLGTTNLMGELESSSATGTWLRMENTSTGGGSWDVLSTGQSNTEGAGKFIVRNSGGHRIVIDANGNIGMGTASPAEKLDVAGKTKTTNFQMTNGATANYVLQGDANGNATWVDPASLTITETDPQVSSTTTSYVPRWNGTTLVDGIIFDNATNVGIGTTSASEKLDVWGNIDLSAVQPVLKFSAIGTPRNSNITATFSPTTTVGQTMRFNLSDNTSTGVIEIMRLQGDGTVGIGTGSPVNKLDVEGGIAIGATYSGTNVAPTNGAIIQGNVGIGTTAPSTALHVVPSVANGPTATFESGSTQFTGAAVKILPSTHATSERASIQLDNWHVLQDRTGTGAEDFAIWQESTNTHRFNIDVNGNVGIGDETPDVKLDVHGSIQMVDGNQAANKVMTSDANGTASWVDPNTLITNDGDWTISGNDQYSAVSGNVGIGTTTPAEVLHVSRNSGNAVVKIESPSASYEARLEVHKFGSYSAGVGYYPGNADLRLRTNTNNSITFEPNGVEKMRIQPDGNVGIGTTGPSELLEVTGRIRATNPGTSPSGSNIILGSPANDPGITMNRGDGSGNSQQRWDMKITSDNAIRLRSANTTDHFVFTNTGNLGIGTTTPSDKLHVIGNIRMVDGNQAAGKVLVSDANGTASWAAATSLTVTETDPQVSSSTTNILPKWNGTMLVDGIVYDNGTNIGIGTISPTAKLDIAGTLNGSGGATFGNNVVTTGDYYLTNTNGTGTSNPSFRIDGNADKLYVIAESNATGPATGTEIRFRTAASNANAADRMTINNIGNVGIGSTSPQEKLHVVGKLRMADGTQGAGKVLVSDANGSASWDDAATLTITETDPQVSASTTNYVPKWNGTTLVDGTVFDNGNIGIGTATPGSRLEVASTTNGLAVVTIDQIGTDQYTGVNIKRDGTEQWFVGMNNADDDFIIRGDATTDHVTVSNANGNVGLGVAAPAAKLDVNGTVRIRGGAPNPDDVLTSTNTSGDAVWTHPSTNVGRAKSTGVFSHDDTDGYSDIVGPVTMTVSGSDIITIQGLAAVRLTGGSGTDDFYYRVRVTGCTTTTLNEVNYRPSEDGSDHDNFMPISYLDYWVPTCAGTVNFYLEMSNTGDDAWEAQDRVLVIRKN